MNAHNKTNLQHHWLQQQADAAFFRGRISDAERNTIIKKYPAGFYSPNIFMRIGLFLLANFAMGSALSLTQLIFSFIENENILSVIALAWGCILIFILEHIIKRHSHFQSGVDDALELYSAITICTGLLTLLKLSLTQNIVIVGFITLLIAIRYINSFMAVVSLISFSAAFYMEYTEKLSFGKSTISFALLIIFLTLIILFSRLRSSYSARFYMPCLRALQVTAMAAFYICGNYYIQREIGLELVTGKNWEEGSSFPADWLYWLLTYIIPATYLLIGIIYKNAIFLRTGLLLWIPTYLTYRNYYHETPLEWQMLVLGSALFLVAFLVTRFLKATRSGYTSRQIKDSSGLEQVEALIIADTFTGTTPTPPITGGGSSGGAGATGNY